MGRERSADCAAEIDRGDTVVRLLPLSDRAFVREVVSAEDGRRISAEPVTRREAEAEAGHPLTALPGPREPRDTPKRALLRLLTANPNTPVRTADVSRELGRETTAHSVHMGVRRLQRDLPIIGIRGAVGGYVLLVPVEQHDSESMQACEYCDSYCWGHCSRTNRAVERRQWCFACSVEDVVDETGDEAS